MKLKFNILREFYEIPKELEFYKKELKTKYGIKDYNSLQYSIKNVEKTEDGYILDLRYCFFEDYVLTNLHAKDVVNGRKVEDYVERAACPMGVNALIKTSDGKFLLTLRGGAGVIGGENMLFYSAAGSFDIRTTHPFVIDLESNLRREIEEELTPLLDINSINLESIHFNPQFNTEVFLYYVEIAQNSQEVIELVAKNKDREIESLDMFLVTEAEFKILAKEHDVCDEDALRKAISKYK